MSEWISCKDRMPEKRVGVLVTDGHVVTAAKWSPIELKPPREPLPWWDGHEFGGYEWDWDFSAASITHWMPLPSPPVQADDLKRSE